MLKCFSKSPGFVGQNFFKWHLCFEIRQASFDFSIENRPPVPQRKSEEKLIVPKSEEKMPPGKSEEKVSRKALVQKSLEEKANKSNTVTESKRTVRGLVPAVEEKKPDAESELDDSLRVPGNATSSSVSVTSSQDDMPMLQKLKDMNKK